jgi:hypothetical protein
MAFLEDGLEMDNLIEGNLGMKLKITEAKSLLDQFVEGPMLLASSYSWFIFLF